MITLITFIHDRWNTYTQCGCQALYHGPLKAWQPIRRAKPAVLAIADVNADSGSPRTNPSPVVSPSLDTPAPDGHAPADSPPSDVHAEAPGVPTEDPDFIASAKDLFDVGSDLVTDKQMDKDLEEQLEKIMSSNDAHSMEQNDKPSDSNEAVPCCAELGKAASTPEATPPEIILSKPYGEQDSFEQSVRIPLKLETPFHCYNLLWECFGTII